MQVNHDSSALVSWGGLNNGHKLGVLKQKLILSQFRRPEVCNQRVGSTLHPLKAPGKNPTLSLPASGSSSKSLAFLSCGCAAPVSASVFTFLSCGCVAPVSACLHVEVFSVPLCVV